MSNSELNIEEYLGLKRGLSRFLKSATQFSVENLKQYNELLLAFEESLQLADPTKGKKLENLVTFIFEHLDIFEIDCNIHTSTNEIDHLIKLSEIGKILSNDGLFDIKGDYMLSECKNYHKKIDVTWVGKFCNLVEEQPVRIGILFSYQGFTGEKWEFAKGLVKKFYYRKERYDEKMYIIDFNLEDFKRIGQGESLINILDEKIKSIELDTDYEKYMTRHPAQE